MLFSSNEIFVLTEIYAVHISYNVLSDKILRENFAKFILGASYSQCYENLCNLLSNNRNNHCILKLFSSKNSISL